MIATFIVHSKLDYCNSLYSTLPKFELSRLQQIQNSLARTVVKAPKFCHITPIGSRRVIGGSVRVERWTCDQQVVGSNPTRRKLRNNFGQVVHTYMYVPLSPSSITWYRPRGGDALWL